ncbi:cupin domain-containing protein [Burkholderia cepacia]|uniref:cupin domain-containing protein n=1 Tax=Burkholderia cepacia TaxID=292 RepID=UPI0039A4FBD5
MARPPRQFGARTRVAIHHGDSEVMLICGRFAFSNHHASVLFQALPPIIQVRCAARQAGILRRSLTPVIAELRNPKPGDVLVSMLSSN